MNSEGVFEEIKRYLPQYLSEEELRNLFEELKCFEIDQRIFTRYTDQKNYILQGDGIRDMLVVHLPSTETKPIPCMVVSNSCDINPDNERHTPMRILYAPIMNLAKYEAALRRDKPEQANRISSHIDTIRRQRVSNVFYLPNGAGELDYEGMVRFDLIQNGPIDQCHPDEVFTRRLFSLSQYGMYLFLIKLSIHFTRIGEGISRNQN